MHPNCVSASNRRRLFRARSFRGDSQSPRVRRKTLTRVWTYLAEGALGLWNVHLDITKAKNSSSVSCTSVMGSFFRSPLRLHGRRVSKTRRVGSRSFRSACSSSRPPSRLLSSAFRPPFRSRGRMDLGFRSAPSFRLAFDADRSGNPGRSAFGSSAATPLPGPPPAPQQRRNSLEKGEKKLPWEGRREGSRGPLVGIRTGEGSVLIGVRVPLGKGNAVRFDPRCATSGGGTPTGSI